VVAGMLENTIELCEPHPKSIGFLRPEAVWAARPVDQVPLAVRPGVQAGCAGNPPADLTDASQIVIADGSLLPSCLRSIGYSSVKGGCYPCLLLLVCAHDNGSCPACKCPFSESKTLIPDEDVLMNLSNMWYDVASPVDIGRKTLY
jgi:hypothetical protein